MAKFKLNLFDDMELHGAFKIEGHTMGGSLHASAGKNFSVKAVGFSDCDALNDFGYENYRRIPFIHFVADDLRECTFVEATLKPIWGTSGSAVNGWTYSIVEGGHFNAEKVFDGVVVDFNLWPEFCHAQGFSKSAEKKDEISISVRDDLKITCCENMMQALCGDASFSNRISFGEELDEELHGEIRAIFEKAKQAHNKDNILVMHKTEHQWFLRFECETKLCGLEGLENLIRSFADLLFILTYKPSTPIACDLYTQNNDDRYKTYYPWRFPISGNKSSFLSGEKFIHQMAPITLPKLGEKWPSVVQSWYEKRSKLSPYINILRANQMEQISDFKYTRCIDALAMIGVELGGTKKNKYQHAVSELDVTNLKDYLMQIFAVKTEQELGQAISNSRAYVVHNEVDAGESLWDRARKCAHLAECFELLIFSYLHREIGVPDDLRIAFQEKWFEEKKGIQFISDMIDEVKGES